MKYKKNMLRNVQLNLNTTKNDCQPNSIESPDIMRKEVFIHQVFYLFSEFRIHLSSFYVAKSKFEKCRSIFWPVLGLAKTLSSVSYSTEVFNVSLLLLFILRVRGFIINIFLTVCAADMMPQIMQLYLFFFFFFVYNFHLADDVKGTNIP